MGGHAYLNLMTLVLLILTHDCNSTWATDRSGTVEDLDFIELNLDTMDEDISFLMADLINRISAQTGHVGAMTKALKIIDLGMRLLGKPLPTHSPFHNNYSPKGINLRNLY